MPAQPISLNDQLNTSPPKNGKYYIVAIDGRGGSGKSSLSKYIQTFLGDYCYICGDNYFEPIAHPVAWGGYNEERFQEDVLRPLAEAKTTIDFRPYDWDHEPHIKDQPFNITRGVFIDRCYSFSFDLEYDLKIWVETPRQVALERGVHRSIMPKERAEKVWSELWKPMEDKYIELTKPTEIADIVIDGTKSFEIQLVA
jgi:uridine kinase